MVGDRSGGGLKELCDFYAIYKARGEPVIVATLIKTEGSTYRKAGTRALFARSGESCGLLSGGCLEADLRERARAVMTQGKPERVIYDSRTSDDPIWGLGLGCEGANHIWLQAAGPENDYAPLGYLHRCLREQQTGCIAMVIGGEARPDEVGRFGYGGVPGVDELTARLSSCRSPKPGIMAVPFRDRTLEVFVSPVILPTALLICGGGPDAIPVAQFADLLGWQVTVVDHRPAYASAANFPSSATVLCGNPEDLTQGLVPSRFDAAVIMSHQLNFDVAYLRRLIADAPRYIGVLGPASRRARILKEVGCVAKPIVDRIRGPVGLQIGANSPATIALAIVGQIHAVLVGGKEGVDAAARV